MVNAPLSLFLRVSIDSGVMVMMPVIFVMTSFWATSISYATFLEDLVDIVPTLLWRGRMCNALVVRISSRSMARDD